MIYDSIVIGGGVMGSSIALRLAQAGQKTLVLERAIPGAEASSAAGGILGPQIEGDRDDALFRLCLASREDYPSLSRELLDLTGVDIGFRRCGLLLAAMGDDDPKPLEARRTWQEKAGLPLRLLSGGEARALEPSLSEATSHALHFPDEGQVDPKALARALPLAATRAGAAFRIGRVRKIRIEGGRAVGVEVDAERIAANNVIVAAGAWTSFVEGVPLPEEIIQPLRGQMVQLSLPGLDLERILFTPRGYVIPRGKGMVVAGSTMERVGFDKRVTAEGVAGILSQAIAALPCLAKAELISSWSGLRPYPRDGLPLIGATSVAGLFVCSGHHRNGILLTPQTATLLARTILEGREPESLAPFSPSRFS